MVSEEFDRCHGTFLQFVDFLCSAVTPATTNAQLIPPLNDLVHLYHLDPESSSDVFWPLDNVEAPKESESSGKLVLDLGGRIFLILLVQCCLQKHGTASLQICMPPFGVSHFMIFVPRSRYEFEISKQHATLKALEELYDNSRSTIAKRKKDKERIQESLDRLTFELQKHEENVASVRRRLTHEKDKWLSSCPDTLKINMEFLQRCIIVVDLLDTVSTMLPSKAWNSLSLELYSTFWGLTLYDLYVPRSRYESEISKQHAALKAMEELSDNSSSAIAKRKKDKERIQESLDSITFELQKHEENVVSVRRRLTHEKD
ncbi:hypothetical protein RHMOL_Rhmol04G0245300 [Rhododendron molle]|uniref:Uncharacterized protein n=1 Tax=Rhododendron molle TaxID=49168 RepID=A0ACC0P475_RHOML|nr:hypothetical protein RHMOL_Rhmol04G0245300 [Rhododendron molle]